MFRLTILAVLVSLAGFAEQLPKDLKWVTNDSDPVYADPNAKKGGTLRSFITSFPLTLRVVGPDSNGSFRGYILDNELALTGFHPNTGNVIPELATHWAYGKDGKTVYYKLDKRAKWSDGKPVTASDFSFALEFYRSKHIVAPWYNNHYTKNFDRVIVFDDHTLAVVGTKRRIEKLLHHENGLMPFPRHAIKLAKGYPKTYNWKVVPTTGPYKISKVKKGKSVEFARIKDWWAKDNRFFKGRFNVDKIRYKVIRDMNIAFEHFKKGEIDMFPLTIPEYWHDKAKTDEFEKGYISKLWFYNQKSQPLMAVFVNQAHPILKDINVRKGIAHSMNIDKVNKTILRGDYERLQSVAEGYGGYTNKSIKARAFDIKKAGEYFDKAGWAKRGPDGIRVKDGKRLSFEMTSGFAPHKDRMVIVKEEAKKAGLEIRLKILDGALAWKTISDKKHELAWTGFSASYVPSPWQSYHSENANKPQTNNFTNMSDPEMDKLITAFENSFVENEKQKLAQQIFQKVHDSAAIIPTFLVPYFRTGLQSYLKFPKVAATKLNSQLSGEHGVKSYSYAPGGLYWIDQDEKKKVLSAKKSRKSLGKKTIIDETYRTK